MISHRRNEKARYTHSILGHVDQRQPSSSQDTDPQCQSDHHTAVRELNLTGSQLVVGCMCFLTTIRLALWAVLKLWLFEP